MSQVLTNATIIVEPPLHEIYLAISICLLLLLFGIFLTTLIRHYRVYWLAEAFVLVVLGITIGGILKVSENDHLISGVIQLVEFDKNLFFIVLLPPIIFNSGLEVDQETFFKNFGTICALAFVGTFISTIVVGMIMYSAGQAGLVYKTRQVEAFTFGSLISATDPVTVIAVFQTLNVRPHLLALVIGESILNDAVAIVLYNTFISFESTLEGIMLFTISGIFTFLKIFFGSFFIGTWIGALSALTFKFFPILQKPEYSYVEAGVVAIFPYFAYSLSEGLNLSGIVSILFCGFAMSRYTQYNLSKAGKNFLFGTFGALAYTAEAFIFIYLGLAVFTSEDKFIWKEWEFSLLAFAACLCSRIASVVPICILSNCCRHRRLGWRDMFILWFSGLRGGIAYALSADSSRLTESVVRENTGQVFQEATTFVTILGLVLFGNTVAYVARCLNLVENPVNAKYDENGHVEMQRFATSEASRGSFSSHFENSILRPILLRRSSMDSSGVDDSDNLEPIQIDDHLRDQQIESLQNNADMSITQIDLAKQ